MDDNKKKDALEAIIQQNTEKGYVLEDDVDEICDKYDLSDLEYNWILNALETRNITVFEKEPAPSFFTHESQLVSEPESASYKENKDESLYGTTLTMQYKGRQAYCKLMPEGCLLLRGSQIHRSCNASSPSVLRARQLYDSKIDWTFGELQEDILLSSPTAAFEFVTGNSHAPAGKIWKDEHGTTLFELRQNANASQVTESNVVESFSPKPETSTSSQEKQGYLPNGSILYMEHEHGEAICRYTYSNEEDYYTILKGSIVNTTISPDCPSYIQTSRERNKEKISETGELIANVLLKGVNRSAGFVTGKREDGLQLWHDDEGHTLYSLIYQRDQIDHTAYGTDTDALRDTSNEMESTETETDTSDVAAADFTDTDALRDTFNDMEFTEIETDTSDVAAADGTDTDALRDTSNEMEFTEIETDTSDVAAADGTDTDALRDISNETEFTEIETDTSDVAAADGTDTDALRDISNETEFTEIETDTSDVAAADITDTDALRDTSNETEFTEIETDTSDVAAADFTDTDALRDTSNEMESTETERARQEIEQRKREEILKMPIKNLGLSFRSFSSLRRARISTIGELIEKDENYMMKAVRNFGRKSFNEVRSKLQSWGLDFKNNEED